MKTLIVYASKYGATKKCADLLKNKISCDCIQVNSITSIEDYDYIILGSCVYVGKVHKDMHTFYEKFKDQLFLKKTSIYLCGLSREEEKVQKVLQDNFSLEFLQHLTSYACVGGILNFPKMNFFEKQVIKMINKESKLIEKIDVLQSYDLIDEEMLYAIVKEC